MTCVEELIEIMIQEYDIRFEDRITVREYKEMIIKGIDKRFEMMYNQYIKEREVEE